MKKIHYFLIFIIGFSCKTKKDKFNYTPFSNSIIHVEVTSNPVDTLKIEARAYTNIPRGRSISNTLSVNKKGNYHLSIEIDRPAKSHLNIGNEQYNIIIFPNDTTHVKISPDNKKLELSFYGSGYTINEYYLKKKAALGYTYIIWPINQSLSSRSTYVSLKVAVDSITSQELSFIKNYQMSNLLPKWFLNYENAEIIYSGAGFKTTIPHFNETFEIFNDSLPGDYFEYLENIKIDNEQAILSTQYIWFLDSYFLKNFPVNEFDHLAGFSRRRVIISHKLKLSKNQLIGDVKEIYHKYSFCSEIKFHSDSLTIDSLANEFQLADYKDLMKVSGQRLKNGIKTLNLKQGDTIPNFFMVNELDSIVSFRKFQDQILYINFWAPWCKPCIKNIPELNKLIALYEDNSRIKFLNICMDSQKDKWLASIAKHELGGTNLNPTGNWNSKLKSYFNINGIPHYVIIKKGNVLYENFTDKAPHVQNKLNVLLGTMPPGNL